MINLLPLDDRKQLRAARTNVLLFRYCIGLVFAAVFVGIATGAIYILMTTMKQSAEVVITDNQAKVANYSTVQAQADDYRKNLSEAQAVFAEEVQFSKLYVELARILPAGTALESLAVEGSSLGTPMELPVKIKGEQQAIDLIAAFKGSAVFSNAASYGTLTMNAGDDKAEYPYVLSVNVTVNKGALK
jgi:hypothetical protein